MKINDVISAVLPEVKKVERPAKKDPPATVSKDVIAISSKAVAMQEGIEAAKNAPDIRAEKVRLLKEEIGKGMYSVRGSNVAEKIIASAFEK